MGNFAVGVSDVGQVFTPVILRPVVGPELAKGPPGMCQMQMLHRGFAARDRRQKAVRMRRSPKPRGRSFAKRWLRMTELKRVAS